MDYTHINFSEQRDFGQVLNTTFLFIRQNFGKLCKALIFYAGPFLLLQAISRIYYEGNVNNVAYYMRMHSIWAFYQQFFTYFSIYMITAALSNLIILLTVYSYIILYIEKGKDGFALYEVWQKITSNFLRVLGASFLTGLLLVVGTCFCVLPGIYLGISLSLVIIIMMFENKSFGVAFSRSFTLSHYHWWWILLLFLTTYMIIYIVSFIFTIPQLVLNNVYKIHSIMDPGGVADWIKYLYAAITVISTFVASLLTIIIFIALTLEYFNIVEKKENPSLLKKIEEMEGMNQ